jgi:hypothetical protein
VDWLDDPMAYHLDPVAMPGESLDEWRLRVAKEIGPNHRKQLLNEYYLRKHRLVERMPDPSETPTAAPTTRLLNCPRFIDPDELPEFSQAISDDRLGLVAIDLNMRLETQFACIAVTATGLRDTHEWLMTRRLPRDASVAIRLLRLHDARASCACPEDIMECLYAAVVPRQPIDEDPADLLRADADLTDWLLASGYRHLAARDPICWEDWA